MNIRILHFACNDNEIFIISDPFLSLPKDFFGFSYLYLIFRESCAIMPLER